jgi:hypothetical protein
MKNAAIGGGTAATTGAVGLAKMTEMIPDDIGKIACLVGIMASTMVIIAQSIKIWLDVKWAKKADLEIEKINSEMKQK